MYTIGDIVGELEDFIHWLASRRSSEDTIMMDHDELVGELYEELVKGFQYYEGHELSKDEMLAVIKRILDNRISELVYKYFVTSRKDGIGAIPVQQLDEFDDDGSTVLSAEHLQVRTEVVVSSYAAVNSQSLDNLVDSRERVQHTRARLSDAGKIVFDAVLNGHPLLEETIKLVGERAAFVYKTGGTVKVKPWHVADAVGLPLSLVKEAFAEIRQVYEDVCNEYN